MATATNGILGREHQGPEGLTVSLQRLAQIGIQGHQAKSTQSHSTVVKRCPHGQNVPSRYSNRYDNAACSPRF